MGRREIGRVLEGSSESPDLRIGMTSADFQTCANVFEENEVLTRFVPPFVLANQFARCQSTRRDTGWVLFAGTEIPRCWSGALTDILHLAHDILFPWPCIPDPA